MNIELFREYCLSRKAAEETLPFGPDVLVFKVMGKMFALISLSEPDRCNLKCDPLKAQELRGEYHAIQPGYHMNKLHWNTVTFNHDVPDKLILSMIDDSYDLIVNSLTRKQKEELHHLSS